MKIFNLFVLMLRHQEGKNKMRPYSPIKNSPTSKLFKITVGRIS